MRKGLAAKGARAVALLAGALCACAEAPAPRAGRRYVVEKGDFQALYGADGALERIAHDGNADRRAETQTFYQGGVLRRAELDDDGDGVVERWEVFSPEGRVVKVGTSSRDDGVPDLWTWSDGHGGVARRETDADGDGRPEAVETLESGRLLLHDFDTDGDGRLDRRLVYGPDGVPSHVEKDADGDGVWDGAEPLRPGPG